MPRQHTTQGKVLDGEALYWVVETLLAAGRLEMAVDVFRSHPRFDCLPTAATLDTLMREAMDMELFELASEVTKCNVLLLLLSMKCVCRRTRMCAWMLTLCSTPSTRALGRSYTDTNIIFCDHPYPSRQLLEATHLGGFRIDATVANRLVGALLDQQCLDHADRCVPGYKATPRENRCTRTHT